MTIPIDELGAENERLMLLVLDLAKHQHEDHPNGAAAAAFVFGAKMDLTVVALAGIPNWGEPGRLGTEAIEILRGICAEKRAYFVAIISDAWVKRITDDEAFRESGLDPSRVNDWLPVDQDRFVVRREALVVSIETHDGYKLLRQFYRRQGPRIVWEELENGSLVPAGLGGRMLDLLPPRRKTGS